MVTIIPKGPQKTSLLQPLLFYFSIGLVIAMALAFFVLNNFANRASDNFTDLEEQIEQVGDADMEDRVIKLITKMEDFSLLVADHQKPSRFFDFLESITHPKVGFLELELIPSDLQANLTGFATDFQSVAQQMYIFQDQEDFIKGVELTELSLGSMGEAIFVLELHLSPALFQ